MVSAEEIVDAALDHLVPSHQVEVTKCTTARVPLDANLPDNVDPVTGPTDPIDNHLWRHFGSGTSWIKARWESNPNEQGLLTETLPYTLAEVSYAVIHEQAECLEDIFVRRLQIFFRDPDQGLGCAEAVARHMASLLGQSDEWVAAELEAYIAGVERSRLGAQALSTHQRAAQRGSEPPPSGQQERVAAS